MSGGSGPVEYVLLASNSFNNVQCFGSDTGRVFRSERSAETMKRKLEKLYPRLDWLVLPISPADSLLRIRG